MSNDFLAQTTLKILINDWSKLREIIGNITKSQRAALSPITESDLSLALVSDDAITDVFAGPFHGLIRPLCEGYALISKLRTYTVISQDDAIKPHVHDTSLDIPAAYQKAVTAAVLDKIQRELDGLAQQQYAIWQEHVKQWQEQILMQLLADGLALSDLEIADLMACEPLFELKHTYQQLNMNFPRTKHDTVSMSDYLRAKTLLVMHNSLGRQLKPHTEAELTKHLKAFKNLFKEIDQQEIKLNQQVKQETEAVIRKLA